MEEKYRKEDEVYKNKGMKTPYETQKSRLANELENRQKIWSQDFKLSTNQIEICKEGLIQLQNYSNDGDNQVLNQVI